MTLITSSEATVILGLAQIVSTIVLTVFAHFTKKQVAETKEKVDSAVVPRLEATATKVDEVFSLTDGRLTKVEDALTAMTNENARLLKVVQEQRIDKVDTAIKHEETVRQVAAGAARDPKGGSVPPRVD